MLPAPVQASIDQLDREAAACEAKARVCRSLADDLRRAHGLPTATSMPDVASTSVVSTSVAAVEAAKRAMPPRRPAIARAPRPRPVAMPSERARTDDAPAPTSPPAPPAPVNPAPIARTNSEPSRQLVHPRQAMPSGWDAKVAAWLLRTLFAGDIGRELNEIIKAIYAQYGRAPIAEVEAVLAEMVATGAIARLGPAAWHRAAPPRPAAADVGMVVDAPWFAPIATVLLEALTAAGPDGRTWSELHAAARTSTSRFNSVLNSLVASRQVARLDGLGKARFRMPIAGVDGLGIPPVKSVPIPPFDAPALETEVARLLGAGTTYTLDELVTSARATQLHANRETVRTALDALIAHGRAAIVRLGSMERFHAGTEAAAS